MKNGKYVILIIFILIIIGSFAFFPKEETLRQFIEQFGVFGPMIFILLVIIEVVLAPIPGAPLYILGGALFGAVTGGIIVLIGNIIGSAICFLLGKYFGRSYVKKLLSKKRLEWFDKAMEKRGAFFIFLVRLNPLTSTDLFSYASGLTKIRFIHFLIATTLGLLPHAFFPALIGDILGDLIYQVIFLLIIIIVAYILFYFIRKTIKETTRKKK